MLALLGFLLCRMLASARPCLILACLVVLAQRRFAIALITRLMSDLLVMLRRLVVVRTARNIFLRRCTRTRINIDRNRDYLFARAVFLECAGLITHGLYYGVCTQ